MMVNVLKTVLITIILSIISVNHAFQIVLNALQLGVLSVKMDTIYYK